MDDVTRGVGTPSTDEPEPRPQPVGDAVGGIVGTAAGAGLGSLGGPLGVLVGAAAGALGGWWAGHAVSHALENYNDAAQRRIHHERTGRDDYEEVRDYYRFGHLAGAHPDYRGRPFEDVEPELKRSWVRAPANRLHRWEDARHYVEEGFRTRDEERVKRDE